MTVDDVMTTLEAGERWGVTPNSLKQNCQGRVKNGFKENEFRKSGRTWLVTRAGMERLYGKEKEQLGTYRAQLKLRKLAK